MMCLIGHCSMRLISRYMHGLVIIGAYCLSHQLPRMLGVITWAKLPRYVFRPSTHGMMPIAFGNVVLISRAPIALRSLRPAIIHIIQITARTQVFHIFFPRVENPAWRLLATERQSTTPCHLLCVRPTSSAEALVYPVHGAAAQASTATNLTFTSTQECARARAS